MELLIKSIEGKDGLSKKFNKNTHIKYLNTMLKGFPKEYAIYSHDKMMAVYFIVCSLDLLNALDKMIFTKEQIVNWVYSLQIPDKISEKTNCYGFMSSDLFPISKFNSGAHLAATYAALCILIICEDDLSRVNKNLAKSLHDYQNPETGCFQALPRFFGPAEEDVRFIFGALCIANILNDWSGIDQEKLETYLLKCQNYSGGFGWSNFSEAHSGLTFCVIASLKMLYSHYNKPITDPNLIYYLVERYDGGWNGRIDKIDDTCYSWWNGATLEILGMSIEKILGSEFTQEFLFSCQKEKGGFSKYAFLEYADILHTFYSLGTLSFFKYFLMKLLVKIAN